MNILKKTFKYLGITIFYILYALQIISIINPHSTGQERLLHIVISGLMTIGIAVYFQKKRIKK
jgi:hypothetical protein